MKPKVSVLIPVFNRRKLIAECVNSILNQTYGGFKIIIYDDASTDHTVLAIPKDKRITIISGEKNMGVAYARNVLLSHTDTPFACWQDSDDLSRRDRLQKQLKKIKDSGADMVFSYMTLFRNGESPYRKMNRTYCMNVNRYKAEGPTAANMCFATGIFRVKACRVETFDPSKRSGGEDLDWVKRLAIRKIKFDIVKAPLYYCRRHEGRITFKRKFRSLKRSGQNPYDDGWIKSHISRKKT